MLKKLCIVVGILLLVSDCISNTDTQKVTGSSDSDQKSSEGGFFDALLANMLNVVLIVFTPYPLVVQLKVIWDAKSAKGISYSSTALSDLVLAIHCGYNFHYGYPVASYGEC